MWWRLALPGVLAVPIRKARPRMAFARRPDGRSRPREALRRFGVDAAAVNAITVGRNAWHWRVRTTEGGRLILRRCNPFRTAESILYEHRVLAALAAVRWPVATALPHLDGGTLVDLDGTHYALFPSLPGRPFGRDNETRATQRGALLAELHHQTRELLSLGPREGWARVSEYADHPEPPDGCSLMQSLPQFEDAYPDLGAALRQWHEHVSPRVRGEDLPSTIVHADFSAWNLLFARGRLTGIIDFDFAHPDARIADIAAAMLLTETSDLRRSVLDGYERVEPLTAAERDLLPDMMLARHLGHAAHALSFWTSGREDMVAQVELALALLQRDDPRR